MSAWAILAVALWIALGFALGAAAFTAWHYRLGKRVRWSGPGLADGPNDADAGT